MMASTTIMATVAKRVLLFWFLCTYKSRAYVLRRAAQDHATLTRRLELAAARQKEWAQQQSGSTRSGTPSYLGYD